MSKAGRVVAALGLLAAGVASIMLVSTVAGIALVVVGTLVMPWYPGMGAGIGTD